MLLILIVVVLVLALGGGVGYRRYGFAGMSPAGLLLIVCLVLYFGGFLHR